jgi:MOSC domain-containing protein YiiM
MEPSIELIAVAQHGIRGDQSYGRSSRQVLLVDQAVLDDFGLKPGDLRENITILGIDLNGLSPGTKIHIGNCLFQIQGECTPCSKLDELQPGLQEAIHGRRGILASVVQGGSISIGDPVTVLNEV